MENRKTRNYKTVMLRNIGKQYGESVESVKKGKGSPYWVTERRVLELILVLGSQPAGDVTE